MIYTVKDLLDACSEQVSKGNGNKKVYISRDDEGNGYHALFYGFTDDPKTMKELDEWCDDLDGKYDDKVILG